MTDPNGIGQQIPDRWAGWLKFTALPDDLQRAEDATHEADLRYVPPDLLAVAECSYGYPDNLRDYRQRCFDRPATDAERTLLAHLGFDVPDTLRTHCDRITASIVRRRWPDLEANAQPPQEIP
jgi:hypothetical protein